MHSYDVEYLDYQGNEKQTTLECLNEIEVYQQLSAMNAEALRIKQRPEKKWLGRWFAKLSNNIGLIRLGVSHSERALFCEVMKALTASGVPPMQAVDLVKDETNNAWLRKRLTTVSEKLLEGDSLSSAMGDTSACRRAFPPMMREAIRTAEESGALVEALDRLAQLFKRAADIRTQTISAMIYPTICFLFFIGICISITILVPWMFNQIMTEAQYNSMKGSFPLPIRVLFFFNKHKIYMLFPPAFLFGFIVLWAIGKRFRATGSAQTRFERKIPMIGKIRYQFAVVRCLDLLITNDKSGIPLAQSLELIRGSVGDWLIHNSLMRMRAKLIDSGDSLFIAMSAPEERAIFSGLIRQMVRAGEEAGQLEEMLEPISLYYNEQAGASLKRALDMLTPIMILLLGAVIGPIIIGVFLTLFQINQAISSGMVG